MTEHAMQPPRSPDAEAPLASPALPDTVSEHAPQFSQEAHSFSAQKDADGLSLAGQEMLQQYMLKRFKTLELQLTLEQQRHRDHMEEELHKMQQHVVAAVQEQHQQQQHVSATVRETVEHMRKEFADALQYLAQDVAQRLRQAEEYTTRALNGLRDEMQHMLREHEQAMTRHQMQAAALATPSKPFPAVPEERQI
jgi:hypothetical protein